MRSARLMCRLLVGALVALPAIGSAVGMETVQIARRLGASLTISTASATNKEAARNLGISPRTVEIHRAHIMHKLGAKNSVDLARRVLGKQDS